ncbi:alpha-amylase/subtilisin inhibitor [Artemisia annua]|uniref:Alpha-amylase/subtilisin inhibitor n=1 Tax=Artemisia annua TaxID=35608 RepID=A0A2U1PRH5_ARTAN|nr:alpha-amylase/subtilisin inhibitor [Artemisia annua]
MPSFCTAFHNGGKSGSWSGQRISRVILAVVVRDTDGNILKAGNNYYILPVMHGVGGGLITARGSGELCPTEVAQAISEVQPGTPLKFIPANPNKDSIIRESTDLNIMFVDPLACVPNAVWRVDTDFIRPEQRTLSSRGLLGRPGPQTINNWFKIQKYQDSYKLVYCPSVCKTCKPACADIGITLSERGRRSLTLNNKPFKVKFKKA